MLHPVIHTNSHQENDMSFYTDEGKTQIKNGLLDKEAEGWSQKLVRMQERGNRIARNSITP